jgi:hypothetical protein
VGIDLGSTSLSAPPKAPSPVAEPLTDVEASLQETRAKLEAAEKKVKGTDLRVGVEARPLQGFEAR